MATRGVNKIGRNLKKLGQTPAIAPKVRRIVNRNPGVELLSCGSEAEKARFWCGYALCVPARRTTWAGLDGPERVSEMALI